MHIVLDYEPYLNCLHPIYMYTSPLVQDVIASGFLPQLNVTICLITFPIDCLSKDQNYWNMRLLICLSGGISFYNCPAPMLFVIFI